LASAFKSVAYKMPKALANRLCHIEMESNFESWRKWAVRGGIHEKIIGFLSARNDLLMGFDAARDDLAFPTPRSWEMVSRLLNMVNQNIEEVYPMISGCIGTGIASEFKTWCEIFATLPKIEDIFAGKCTTVPKSTDALYALVSSMVSYAREHKSDFRAIENSINYSMLLPPDFSVVHLRGYMAIDENYRHTLMKLPAFSKWLSARGKHINGMR